MSEQKWIEEFEKVWEERRNPKVHPEGCLCWACEEEEQSRPYCLDWWLESRRRLKNE